MMELKQIVLQYVTDFEIILILDSLKEKSLIYGQSLEEKEKYFKWQTNLAKVTWPTPQPAYVLRGCPFQ